MKDLSQNRLKKYTRMFDKSKSEQAFEPLEKQEGNPRLKRIIK